jgi:hypothetical protein
MTVSVQAKGTQGEINTAVNHSHKKEVCAVVLKKLKSSFENLRAGKITNKKTEKVADLLQSYRLLECGNEKLLFDVLACTNTQIMFLEDCRKIRW